VVDLGYLPLFIDRVKHTVSSGPQAPQIRCDGLAPQHSTGSGGRCTRLLPENEHHMRHESLGDPGLGGLHPLRPCADSDAAGWSSGLQPGILTAFCEV
jgi:hypothetical protein